MVEPVRLLTLGARFPAELPKGWSTYRPTIGEKQAIIFDILTRPYCAALIEIQATTALRLPGFAEDELVQVEQVDNTQVGYGILGVAAPIISANSDWGSAVKIFAFRMCEIGHCAFRD